METYIYIYTINRVASVFFKRTITIPAITLFFILSGVAFFRNYDKAMYCHKLKARIKSLLIPFLIWNVVWMIFEIITSYSFISAYFLGREKFELTVSNVLTAIFHYGCNGPFWFVFELFFFVIITPVIDKAIKNKYVGLFVVITLIILAEFNIGLPSPLFYSKHALAYYILGGVVGRHYFEKFRVKSGKKIQVCSVLSLLCCFAYKYTYAYLGYEYPLIIDKAAIVLSAISFWYAMDIVIDRIKLRDFYSYSFAVFAMHINVSAVVSKLWYLILPKTQYFAIPNFVLTLVTTLGIINLFCLALRRFLPKTYSVLMGER